MEVYYVDLLVGALGGANIRPEVRPSKNPEPLRSRGEVPSGLQRMYWSPSGWEGKNLGRIMFRTSLDRRGPLGLERTKLRSGLGGTC